MASVPTGNYAYNKPANGDAGWGATTNGNWDLLDADLIAEHESDGTHADITPTKVTLTGGFFNIGTAVELTVAAGVVTATQTYHAIDTQSDDATDDLDTISGGTGGDILVLRSASSTRDTTLKHGVDNLYLDGAADFTLDNIRDTIMLLKAGASWYELSRSNNS